MEKMVEALTPAFVASFALQQLLELLDPLLDRFARPNKKWILSAISLVMALAVTLGLGLRLLAPFGLGDGGVWDAIVGAGPTVPVPADEADVDRYVEAFSSFVQELAG